MKSYTAIAEDAKKWMEDTYVSYKETMALELKIDKEDDRKWTQYLNSQIETSGVVIGSLVC